MFLISVGIEIIKINHAIINYRRILFIFSLNDIHNNLTVSVVLNIMYSMKMKFLSCSLLLSSFLLFLYLYACVTILYTTNIVT